MALRDDVDLLVDYGLFNEDAIGRIANAIRTVQDLAGGNSGPVRRGPGRRGRRPGRPAGSGRGPGRPPKAAGTRGPRSKWNPTKEELAKLRETMTGKEIAAKMGVSVPTVALKAKKLGLTTPRGPRKGKK
jgi:hypothetical protein